MCGKYIHKLPWDLAPTCKSYYTISSVFQNWYFKIWIYIYILYITTPTPIWGLNVEGSILTYNSHICHCLGCLEFRSTAKINYSAYQKWGISFMHGVLSGYMQEYIPSASDFFRPRPSTSDEKLPRLGAKFLHIALQKTIYSLHIS